MAFAFGKQRDKHMAPVTSARPEDRTDDGALDDALETGRRFGLVVFIANQVRQFQGDVVTQIAAQTLKIDAAGAQYGDGVLIFGQGEQQVFEGGVFMVQFVGVVQRLMQCILEVFDNMASRLLQGTLQRMLVLTSKSMTWVTFSATS